MKKTAFVKISGDLIARGDVLTWIKSVAKDYFVVICSGGGMQINDEFAKKNIPVKFGPLGREIENLKDRQFARDILERNRVGIENLLKTNGIKAKVVIPILDIESILCHVNGDVYIKAVYLGFDKLYILTLSNRVRKKQKEFIKYPKIEVIGF